MKARWKFSCGEANIDLTNGMGEQRIAYEEDPNRRKRKLTRMFEGLRTWNPIFGCQHNCYYGNCWAKRRLAHRMGKLFKCESCFNFIPHLHAERLTKIPPDPRIFVVAHGDLFGQWVPADFIKRVLTACCDAQKTMKPQKEIWFFETKNPARYTEFIDRFPQNSVLSTTIETNRIYDEKIRGNTPNPLQRYSAMLDIVYNTQFPIHISIEPIMDFDSDFASWIKAIHPSKVAVGFDSLNNHLPEPSKEKTEALITEIRKFTFVERKGGL